MSKTPKAGQVWLLEPWGWLLTILEGGSPEQGFPYRRTTAHGGLGQGFLGINTIREGLAEQVCMVNGHQYPGPREP
jgi:hypothetical protein